MAGSVVSRIKADQRLFEEIVHRDDYPTDMGDTPPARTHKHTVFGLQEGLCGGCGISFPFRNLTIDRKIPRNKGGTDHFENLWLLCDVCNSAKGTSTVAEFRAKLNQ
jgi:5-methylcytosine-specific restriction endonuclease McrA